MKLTHKVLSLIGLISLLACAASAQVITGTPSFGSFGGGPDQINLANLNVHLTIPVMNKPGRGVPFVYDITYDNSIWQPVGSSGSQTWEPTNVGMLGWTYQAIGSMAQDDLQLAGYCYTQLPPPYGYTITGYEYVWQYAYIDRLGNAHLFPGYVEGYYGTCGSTYSYAGGTAIDGSGYTLALSSSGNVTVTAAGGQYVYWSSSNETLDPPYATDTNGNEITMNSSGQFFDTLSSSTPALTVSGTAPSSTTFSYTPPGGGSPVYYTMKYTSYTLQTAFGCSGIAEYSATQYLVTEIDLPDQGTVTSDRYLIQYEQPTGYGAGYTTGRISSVTLPTGGTISYSYSGGSSGHITCADGSAATLTRTTPDGPWTYAHSESGTAWSTTQTDPESNETAMNFQTIYPTERQTYQGTSTLLKTDYICYNGTSDPCNSTAIALPITQKTVYRQWPNGSESEVNTLYDKETSGSTTYSYGLVTLEDDYDYGSGGPGGLLRTTQISYASLGNGIVNRPASILVEDGSGNTKSETTYTYDGTSLVSSGISTQHVSVSGSRGNPTTVSEYVNSSSTISQTYTYFDTGMVQVAKDGKGNATTYAYSTTYAGAYPTTITNALSQVTTSAYDFYTGLLTSSTDPNSQTTSRSYDELLRLTQVNYPDGGQTIFDYEPSSEFPGNYLAEAMQKIDTSGDERNTWAMFDGLGRQTRGAVTNGEAEPYDETQNTCFNADGLPSFQAYPFQDSGWTGSISCSIAGDSYAYDALARPTKIAHADGSYGSISYSANCATETDEQSKSRQFCTDGVNRLTQVIEDPGGLNYTTTYTYDPLNDITSVTQGSETRTFAYDWLARLTSAKNPETVNVATSYTYDAASNVVTRTDGRSITMTYNYDALNRLTQKSSSDGTIDDYYYYDAMPSWWSSIPTSNSVGRLTAEGTYNGSNWLSAAWFGYDAMGRITGNAQWHTDQATVYQVPYTYDLIGDMLTYSNGAGVTFTQSFNVAGLPTQLTSNWVDSQHPGTLLSAAHYDGAGGTTSYALGNGLTETVAYNSLTQPCRMNANSSGTLLGSCTASVPSGNLLDLTLGYNYGSADNGNVMSLTAAGQQTFSRSYSYDGVNRLSTMSAPGDQCTGLSWTYDEWGNRTAQSATGGTCDTFSQSANTYNQFSTSPYQYDAAGNMTHDASHSYTYDAENHIIAVDGGSTATYTYDVNGWRASKVVGGVATDYYHDLGGDPIAEYGGGCGATCWLRGNIYFDGQMVAEYWGSTYFITRDHLGSARVVTEYPTPTVAECDDFYPYGEVISCGSSGTTAHKFTGYERDSESNLDNAQARYYGSALGRFMSPDPVGNAVADPAEPQTWNMYAYVNNNPLTTTDPSGLDPGDPCDGAGPPCVDSGYPMGGGEGGGGGPDPCAGIPNCILSITTGISGGGGGPVSPCGLLCDAPTIYTPPSPGICLDGPIACGFPPPQIPGGGGGGPSPPQQTPPSSPNACEQQNLNAVNNQFGTGFTTSNVDGMFQYSEGAPPGQGTLNLDISVPLQYQSNGISPGRYPVNWWTYVIGYGATLHIPSGPVGLDSSQTLLFSNSQFTEHLDSAFPYNPFGLLIHFLKDVLGIGGHNPCP